ncbi:MAG: Endoplasmic reticulum zinc transporter [Geoglossum simile]|nr:MAG: Endoplasmic reticulum zinc transporter [Geoglossum simile]
MASGLPLPVPPRTPSPPPEDEQTVGLGLYGGRTIQTDLVYDLNALSPMSGAYTPHFNSMAAAASQKPSGSPMNILDSFDIGGTSNRPPSSGNPFNFQTTTLSKSPVMKSNVGQRRGHKFKHSSVSHQIFQEPPPRAPLALPASLPMPTFNECRRSMSKDQRSRISWCLCHALVAGYTLWSAQGSLALTALSHLILFDALGATLCVIVDVLGNFEVWKRSSIRHPFGLERAEVLAGFAMSVFLLFMGMDLISHNLQHVLEHVGHEPQVERRHQRVSPGSVDVASLLAIISTLVSAIGLKNHARIGKAMRFAYISSLPSVLSNPSHFLTLSCSALLLLLPLLSVEMYVWLDRLLSITIAVSMCVLGFRLVKTLGFMLLMSYSGSGVSEVMREIESDPAVSTVEEARFWQVHYGLCMANLKLTVHGSEDTVTRLRERVTSLIRNRLGGGYGSGGQRWEVSMQMTYQ